MLHPALDYAGTGERFCCDGDAVHRDLLEPAMVDVTNRWRGMLQRVAVGDAASRKTGLPRVAQLLVLAGGINGGDVENGGCGLRATTSGTWAARSRQLPARGGSQGPVQSGRRRLWRKLRRREEIRSGWSEVAGRMQQAHRHASGCAASATSRPVASSDCSPPLESSTRRSAIILSLFPDQVCRRSSSRSSASSDRVLASLLRSHLVSCCIEPPLLPHLTSLLPFLGLDVPAC